ncbi:hypothetical protein DPX16_22911 [Anabarilius grahami]|uniref:Uncharacterized protein n=1 Tax=Anabarilius grahami TaxID=495550 RepID=A0A3N0XM95_ANAGA|nr:hypothetical protein DPX16_22911 [Anabarilius grahami]
MVSDESETAAESSKREPKLTAKALALKSEALQKDRKAKVNQMKNLILSMKDLMKCDENALQVSSMLGSLKCLKDDASVLHKEVLPFIPPDDQKQNEWFGSVSKHNDGFVEHVEGWLNQAKNHFLSILPQSYANLRPSLSVVHDTREMDNPDEPQLSCDSNIPSSDEPVSSSHNMNVPSECQKLYGLW